MAGIGTGGTLSGIGSYLKDQNPNVKVYGIEPEASPIITKGQAGPHKIQGIGANFIPKNYFADIVDDLILISDDEAYEMVRQVANDEGILLGISAGANIAAAKRLAERFPNKKIVTVAPDGADKYMSMGIF